MPQKSSASEGGGGSQAGRRGALAGGGFQSCIHVRIIAENSGHCRARTTAAGDNEVSVFNVLLYEPEIPPNTGNSIRLCANTGAHLHLVGKLGFDLSDTAAETGGAGLPRPGAGVAARGSCRPALRPSAPRGCSSSRPTAPGAITRRASSPATASCSAGKPPACPRRWSRPLPPAMSGCGSHAAGQPQPESVQCRRRGGLRGLAPERLRGADDATVAYPALDLTAIEGSVDHAASPHSVTRTRPVRPGWPRRSPRRCAGAVPGSRLLRWRSRAGKTTFKDVTGRRPGRADAGLLRLLRAAGADAGLDAG